MLPQQAFSMQPEQACHVSIQQGNPSQLRAHLS
jgi:hypothetical protein